MRCRRYGSLKIDDARNHLINVFEVAQVLESRTQRLDGGDVFCSHIRRSGFNRMNSLHLTHFEHVHDAYAFKLQQRLKR